MSITYPYEDVAFIPAPLPPRGWEIGPSLWPQIAEARQALGNLNGVGANLPNPELLLRPLQQREALRSSSLEGTYATPQELLLFELEPKEHSPEGSPENEWREVFNYAEALRRGYNYLLQSDSQISLFLIRKLHEWLVSGVRGGRASPGQFRDGQVCIGSDRRFVPPPPTHLNDCLDQLAPHLNDHSRFQDSLVAAYLVHYQFETIHPFTDGNGRVGRLLLALMTWNWCGLSKPWLYMSSYFEKHKDEYIDRLFQVSAEGAWEPWVAFCVRGTIEQARDSVERCRKLVELRKTMLQRVEGGSIRLAQIIEGLFKKPVTTAPQVRDAYNVTFPTAKADIERLVLIGVLKKLEGIRRPVPYIAPEIMAIAYSD